MGFKVFFMNKFVFLIKSSIVNKWEHTSPVTFIYKHIFIN